MQRTVLYSDQVGADGAFAISNRRLRVVFRSEDDVDDVSAWWFGVKVDDVEDDVCVTAGSDVKGDVGSTVELQKFR